MDDTGHFGASAGSGFLSSKRASFRAFGFETVGALARRAPASVAVKKQVRTGDRWIAFAS
jgi:non-ribosomal peptide synthetase component F